MVKLMQPVDLKREYTINNLRPEKKGLSGIVKNQLLYCIFKLYDFCAP